MSSQSVKTYLCGGINGLPDSDCKDWREKAKQILASETIDPMRRDYRGRESECVKDIVEGDLRDIQACNFVLVNAVRPSWGTAMEVFYASSIGKPSVAFVGDAAPSPWLLYHTSTITRTLEEAVDWINQRTPGRAA